MFYLASTKKTAQLETKSNTSRVGRWRTKSALRVLDLRSIPRIPSMLSNESRKRRLGIIFLHAFVADIIKPVKRDNLTHIEYLPSQVATEFLRDFEFPDGSIDGILYPSTLQEKGWNAALFLGHNSPAEEPYFKKLFEYCS